MFICSLTAYFCYVRMNVFHLASKSVLFFLLDWAQVGGGCRCLTQDDVISPEPDDQQRASLIAASCRVIVQRSSGRGNESRPDCSLVSLTGQTGTLTVSRPRLVPLPHISVGASLTHPCIHLQLTTHTCALFTSTFPTGVALSTSWDLTTENLWNLRLDMPFGLRCNDKGVAAPAQVLKCTV